MGEATSTGRATWDQFTRRMEGVADRECTNKGFAVISIDILVSADGEPLFWAEPKITRLEPRIGAVLFMERILEIMGQSSSKG